LFVQSVLRECGLEEGIHVPIFYEEAFTRCFVGNAGSFPEE
jgi:hypothetical protein